MTDILGHLRIVRDGEDVTSPGVQPDTFYLWQDKIMTFSDDEIINFLRVLAEETFTPARLEPCPALSWRTDVENAPIPTHWMPIPTLTEATNER